MTSTSDDLFAAIDADDVDRVREVLADESSLATARDAQGVSALLRARYRGKRELVDAIRPHVIELDAFESAAFGDVDRLTVVLHEDPNLVDARSGDGFSALHLAAFFGKDGAVRLLLASAAEPDARGTGWMTGTPLHSAASGRHVESVRALLESGADPNARQSGGWTALHAAAHGGDAELTAILLAAGADPLAETDDGRSVLDLALETGDEATVRAIEDALGS